MFKTSEACKNLV
jgi:hypothetical protein